MTAAKSMLTAVGTVGTSAWISMTGWPAIATVCAMAIAGAAIICWVLCSADRTDRLRTLILALRTRR